MQLVIHTPGTAITQRDECFHLKGKYMSMDISPLKLESIVVCNKAVISSQAVILALEHNIDIIFQNSFGHPVGRIWFPKMGSTALIRRKQLEAFNSIFSFNLICKIILWKLHNQKQFLKKLMYARPRSRELFQDHIATITQVAAQIEELPNQPLDDSMRKHIRGLEGCAGRAYFQCLAKIMLPKYQFNKRSKRPAKDPFNAVLNYCYGMLYPHVEKACILAGLDPYIGFLHVDNYNTISLVFDLIEPFRIFAEQTAVYLFTGKKIKDQYFEYSENSVCLNQNGKPIVVEAMNSYLDKAIRYRHRNVKRKIVILHETHRLANMLLKDSPYSLSEWLQIENF